MGITGKFKQILLFVKSPTVKITYNRNDESLGRVKYSG